jgi:hypothetical protein
MNWEITLSFHWPHDRFAIGWEYIGPSKDQNIDTITLFLLISTISINLHR